MNAICPPIALAPGLAPRPRGARGRGAARVAAQGLGAALAASAVSVRITGATASLVALTSNSPFGVPGPGQATQFAAGARTTVVAQQLAVEQFVTADVPPLPGALTLNATRTFDERPVASAPFHFSRTGIDRERALGCLAAAAWYEAGDDAAGERAVIQVVLNRVRHPAYPSSVCGVVFQGSDLPTGCQFTFSCDGALARRPGPDAWRRARFLAAAALDGAVDADVGGATHYHADYVYPWWAPRLRKLAQVGPHVFYRFAWSRQFAAAPQHAETAPEPEVPRLAFALAIPDTAPNGAVSGIALIGSVLPIAPVESPVGALAGAGPAASVDDGTIRFTVDSGQPSGRWALRALASCTGRRDCRVVGLAQPDIAGPDPAAHASVRSVPLFVFVRDSRSQTEIAMWDCARAARADRRECLPEDPGAVRRLLQMGQAPAGRAPGVAAASAAGTPAT